MSFRESVLRVHLLPARGTPSSPHFAERILVNMHYRAMAVSSRLAWCKVRDDVKHRYMIISPLRSIDGWMLYSAGPICSWIKCWIKRLSCWPARQASRLFESSLAERSPSGEPFERFERVLRSQFSKNNDFFA